MDPLKWGWKKLNDHYAPVITDQRSAPEYLLKNISCRCKSDTNFPCSSHLCSCRKYGLPCLSSCKHCLGVSCTNKDNTFHDFHDDEEEDECEDVNNNENVLIFDDDLEFFIPWINEEVL